ncbi:MAG: hypothetical protein O2857_14935 [Planctomycetota bacterium]|nr:hypothetical protein [Planctomycetota bacterium]
MNWHEVIDDRNWAMDQVIARVLRQEPAKLEGGIVWIDKRMSDPDYSQTSKDALQEWLDVIDAEGLVGILRVLADRGQEATRMRQSSPFAVLMPQDERKRILKKYESLRPGTHSAGV